MNGAGELYLGYRFRHLEVFDYLSTNKDHILLELYYMERPEDAFGLLSLDWGGKPISYSGLTDAPSKILFPHPQGRFMEEGCCDSGRVLFMFG
jgi:hypothetical protein